MNQTDSPKRMRKNIEYIHSDSWVLPALIYSGFKNGARLEDILGAGDVINHAIFCYEEIEGAFDRLSAGKYSRRQGKLFFPSDKTMKWRNECHGKRSYIFKDLERTSKFLNAKAWEKNTNPQKVNKGFPYNGGNREMFQQAVDNYLDKAGSSSHAPPQS